MTSDRDQELSTIIPDHEPTPPTVTVPPGLSGQRDIAYRAAVACFWLLVVLFAGLLGYALSNWINEHIGHVGNRPFSLLSLVLPDQPWLAAVGGAVGGLAILAGAYYLVDRLSRAHQDPEVPPRWVVLGMLMAFLFLVVPVVPGVKSLPLVSWGLILGALGLGVWVVWSRSAGAEARRRGYQPARSVGIGSIVLVGVLLAVPTGTHAEQLVPWDSDPKAQPTQTPETEAPPSSPDAPKEGEPPVAPTFVANRFCGNAVGDPAPCKALLVQMINTGVLGPLQALQESCRRNPDDAETCQDFSNSIASYQEGDYSTRSSFCRLIQQSRTVQDDCPLIRFVVSVERPEPNVPLPTAPPR